MYFVHLLITCLLLSTLIQEIPSSDLDLKSKVKIKSMQHLKRVTISRNSFLPDVSKCPSDGPTKRENLRVRLIKHWM